jgi:hypothetical protein
MFLGQRLDAGLGAVLTRGLSARARETVAVFTPAILAKSASVRMRTGFSRDLPLLQSDVRGKILRACPAPRSCTANRFTRLAQGLSAPAIAAIHVAFRANDCNMALKKRGARDEPS